MEKVVVKWLRAVEHQVLEQVGEPGLARRLILRAHVVPDVHLHQRRRVVLVHHHSQAIGQHEGRGRYVERKPRDRIGGGLPRSGRMRPARHHADQYQRSEEHTSELQSLMRISYAVFCLKKKKTNEQTKYITHYNITNTDITQTQQKQ